MMEAERQATLARLADLDDSVVLAVQDTTTFNFKHRQSLAGLGVLDNNQTLGFFAHTTLAVTVAGVPLGLLEQRVWVRPHNPEAKDNAHQQLPITQKESYKWLEGLQRSLTEGSERTVITVCDREADIYELFQYAHDHQGYYVIRVKNNRLLHEGGKLGDRLERTPFTSQFRLFLPRRVQDTPQAVRLAIRFTTVTLKPPQRRGRSQVMALNPLPVQLVEVLEVNPPANTSPIHWRLYTNLPVETLEQAHTIRQYYTCRWLVERFHYVLKSGCHLEDSQLRTLPAIQNLLGLCSSVAWRLLQMTYQARMTPDASCELILTTDEWQALSAYIHKSPKPLAQPPALNQAIRWIAQLGGFPGRKGDGEPGVKVLWRGWARLQDIVDTWHLFHPHQDVGNA